LNSIYTEIKSEEAQKSVGMILKQARQKHSIGNLNVIARELCIMPYLLKALEQDDFDSFPSYCYATGFVKNYSNYLGLDTKDIIARYEVEYAGLKESVVINFPEIEKHNGLVLKSIAGVTSLCLVILVGVWMSYNSLDAEEAIDSTPPVKLSMPATVETKTPVFEDNKSGAIFTDGARLKANQDVWVRLSDSNGTVRMEKILARGEDLIVPNDQGISLMTNNAAALSIYIDGMAVATLGGEGKIIENISLEQETLLEYSTLD